MDVLKLVKKRRRRCLKDEPSTHAVSFYDTLLDIATASCQCDCLSTDEGLSHFLGVAYLQRLFEGRDEELKMCVQSLNEVLTTEEVQEAVKLGSLVFSETAPAKSIKEALPTIADTMRTILSSHYFTSISSKPTDPVLNFVKSQLADMKKMKMDGSLTAPVKQLVKDVKNLKKEIASGSTREREKPASELGSLTNRQLKRLLHALRSRNSQNGLLQSLFTTKPPHLINMLSHKQALEFCVEHARLWLFHSDIPIYESSELSYKQLGSVSARELEATLLTSEAAYLTKSICWKEKTLRHQAVDKHIADGSSEENLHGETQSQQKRRKPV